MTTIETTDERATNEKEGTMTTIETTDNLVDDLVDQEATAPNADDAAIMGNEIVFPRLWGTFETLSPLVQTSPGGSKKDGKETLVWTRSWSFGGANMPVVSGDSIRGKLRRTLTYDLLDRCGTDRKDVFLSVGQLLVVGGALGNLQNTLTSGAAAELRHLVPMLALLGGTPLGGWLPGRLMAGAWVAQTLDTPGPALRRDREGLPKAEATFVEENFAKRGLLDESAWQEDEAGKLNLSTKVGSSSKRTASSAMPHAYRGVVPGTEFAGWVALRSYRGLTDGDDEVQRSCLRWGLERAFQPGEEVVLGLRSASGYGIVRFAWDLSSLPPVGLYEDFVAENAHEIGQYLRGEKLQPKVDKEKAEARKEKAAARKKKAAARANGRRAAAQPASSNGVQ